MDRVRWGTGPVVLLAVLALSGCSEVNKGSAKGADFERALKARHGALVEDIHVGAQNSLPWMGTFDATVTLLPTASMADLAAVESTIAEIIKDPSDSAVVWANGIEICAEGAGPRAQHLALRGQLLASSASLAGRLECEDGYAGELADLSADIPVVQSAVAADASITDLRIDGRIRKPSGEVDGLWRELTPHVAEALGAVTQEDLNSFELHGTDLSVKVQPGVDVTKLGADVKDVAPDVVLTVLQGDDGASGAPEAAALRAELGRLPGVQSVRFTSAKRIVVRVATPADVAPMVGRARELSSAVGSFHLHVTTQASDNPLWTVDAGADFEVAADADLAHVKDFAALVGSDKISAVGWREDRGRAAGAPMVTITAPGGGDLRDVLPIVKAHVPDGAVLNLHLGDKDYYFDVASKLDSTDGQVRELPRTFVETWNSIL
ncbi:hypothetical protein [Janibacter sp. HTCC2649]|uniref:hypothetical protein n=1 Tax=Janibacter sp. HTCC2649 TaxID=313589 RepID=UPI0011D2975A|nr:hypothetical protein [Janibacter sp. HTCC2649]